MISWGNFATRFATQELLFGGDEKTWQEIGLMPSFNISISKLTNDPQKFIAPSLDFKIENWVEKKKEREKRDLDCQ